MQVDVVVVGAGPAGGMAACKLAQTGMTILIIEKEKLPRHKPCGGAMPTTAQNLFDWDISPYIQSRTFLQRSYNNFSQPKDTQNLRFPIIMVDRSQFDFHIIEKAIFLGHGNVRVWDRTAVTHIEETFDKVHLTLSNGERIRANYVIGADGAFGKTAQYLGLNNDRKYGIAIDAEIEVKAEVFDREKHSATFNYFCIPAGYGWIFPKDGYLSCGIVGWKGKPSIKHYMKEFLQKSFPENSILSERWYGHIIPMYTSHKTLATRRTCLVGDAASLADGIIGEGIRFALRSGALAGELIAKGETSLHGYQNLIHAGIGYEHHNLYNIAAQIFYRLPDVFYEKFVLQGVPASAFSTRVVEQHIRNRRSADGSLHV